MIQALYDVVVGNVIGVVEEPTIIDPSQPIAVQIMVRIGVVDPKLPLGKDDACRVIEHLREFLVANVLPNDERSRKPR